METKLIGEIDQDILDLLLGQGNVGFLRPSGVWLARTMTLLAAFGKGRRRRSRGVLLLMLIIRSGVLIFSSVLHSTRTSSERRPCRSSKKIHTIPAPSTLTVPSLHTHPTTMVSRAHRPIAIIVWRVLSTLRRGCRSWPAWCCASLRVRVGRLIGVIVELIDLSVLRVERVRAGGKGVFWPGGRFLVRHCYWLVCTHDTWTVMQSIGVACRRW